MMQTETRPTLVSCGKGLSMLFKMDAFEKKAPAFWLMPADFVIHRTVLPGEGSGVIEMLYRLSLEYTPHARGFDPE